MRTNILMSCIIVAGLLCCLCGYAGNLNSKDTRIDDLSLNDLLITVDALPSGWFFLASGKSVETYRSHDSAAVAFRTPLYPKSTGCSQDVFRHKTIKIAKRDYQRRADSFGETPDEWTYESQLADESDFRCYYYSNTSFPLCWWVARYDRIVVEFNSWLVPGYMTLEDMEKVVREIDENAGRQILGKEMQVGETENP